MARKAKTMKAGAVVAVKLDADTTVACKVVAVRTGGVIEAQILDEDHHLHKIRGHEDPHRVGSVRTLTVAPDGYKLL